MSRARWRLGSRAVATIVGGLVVMTFAASADAACYRPQQQLPAQQIADFLANPQQALLRNPQGGGMLVRMIRDLLASDSATLPVVLALRANAGPAQKSAIGVALGQAARICVRIDQAYAGQIQQTVVDTQDNDLIAAYQLAAGDVQIAAGPGGGPPSPGALGGSTGGLGGGGGGGGPVEGIGGGAVPTGPFAYNPRTVGVTTIGGTTTTTTITAVVSGP